MFPDLTVFPMNDQDWPSAIHNNLGDLRPIFGLPKHGPLRHLARTEPGGAFQNPANRPTQAP